MTDIIKLIVLCALASLAAISINDALAQALDPQGWNQTLRCYIAFFCIGAMVVILFKTIMGV